MKSSFLKVVLVGLALCFSACTTLFEPKVESAEIKNDKIFSSLASLSHLTVSTSGTGFHSCLGRGADATFSQMDDTNVSLSLVSTAASNSGEKSGNSGGSNETEMSGRTPAVLLAREFFYRACEFSNNYQLSKEEALNLYLKTMTTVSEGWQAETANTTITTGETLNVNDTTSNPESSAQVAN